MLEALYFYTAKRGGRGKGGGADGRRIKLVTMKLGGGNSGKMGGKGWKGRGNIIKKKGVNGPTIMAGFWREMK